MQSQKELLHKYVEAVMAAPQSLGLTAAADAAEFWERHVLDALKLLEVLPAAWLEQRLRAVDIGSGNGVPGIPIAIASPNWRVTLIDSSAKKSGFLDMFCKFNGVENVTVIPGRAEELGRREDLREQFDIGFARALG